MSRPDDVSLIRNCYRNVYGANPDPSFGEYAAVASPLGTGAVLGYRRASEGRLFLETYLDRPIEDHLAVLLDAPVDRARVVEIGNLASINPMAMITLWGAVANDLGARDEIAVATLTSTLRRMFTRIGVAIRPIAPARPEGRVADAAQWGSYYDSDPVVCFGAIAQGQQAIARFMSRRAMGNAA